MSIKGTRYLALLRGINVGGRNIIAKDDLKMCFEQLNLQKVSTYIQSGNVLFRSNARNVVNLRRRIESALAAEFNYDAQVVVFSYRQYALEIDAAPKSWGIDDSRKHNALFLIGPQKPTDVIAQLPELKKQFETVGMGNHSLFWSASKKYLGQTTMMKLASLPIYKQMTVRNANTTRKLLTLLENS